MSSLAFMFLSSVGWADASVPGSAGAIRRGNVLKFDYEIRG